MTPDVSSEVIAFSCPLPPPGLRRNSETRKHAYRAKLKDQYSEDVWCAGHAGVLTEDGFPYATAAYKSRTWPWDNAHLTLVWKHAGVAPDHDNGLSSCKVLVDTCHTRGRRPLGIFIDDSPDHLTVEFSTRKVQHRNEEGIDVMIERRR